MINGPVPILRRLDDWTAVLPDGSNTIYAAAAAEIRQRDARIAELTARIAALEKALQSPRRPLWWRLWQKGTDAS